MARKPRTLYVVPVVMAWSSIAVEGTIGGVPIPRVTVESPDGSVGYLSAYTSRRAAEREARRIGAKAAVIEIEERPNV